MPNKIIRVSNEFDKLLKEQLQKLINDCKVLGLKPKRFSKPKITRLLAKRIQEMEKDEKKYFKLL